MKSTDCIEKVVELDAPVARVWRAIADAREFGAWFGLRLDGAFVAGREVRGVIVPTGVDAEVAAAQRPFEGTPVVLQVEDVIAERRFSFRWHPFAVDPRVDLSGEPTTLVAFELEPLGARTRLRITESGFDALPLERRAAAFQANDGGWDAQARLVARYLLQGGRQ